MFLIYLKEPKRVIHLRNRLYWLCGMFLKITNSKESLVPKSDFTGFTEFSFRKETTVSDILKKKLI